MPRFTLSDAVGTTTTFRETVTFTLDVDTDHEDVQGETVEVLLVGHAGEHHVIGTAPGTAKDTEFSVGCDLDGVTGGVYEIELVTTEGTIVFPGRDGDTALLEVRGVQAND